MRLNFRGVGNTVNLGLRAFCQIRTDVSVRNLVTNQVQSTSMRRRRGEGQVIYTFKGLPRTSVRKDGFEPPPPSVSEDTKTYSDQLSYSRIRAGSGIRTHGVILSFQLGRLAQSTTMRHLHARFFTEGHTLTCGSRRSFHSVTLVVRGRFELPTLGFSVRCSTN